MPAARRDLFFNLLPYKTVFDVIARRLALSLSKGTPPHNDICTVKNFSVQSIAYSTGVVQPNQV